MVVGQNLFKKRQKGHPNVPHVLRSYTEGEHNLKGSCLVMLSKTGPNFSSKRGQIAGWTGSAQLWTDDPCDVHPHGGRGLHAWVS